MIQKTKDILKIVISIFIIFLLIRSCSKAYTWEDTKEYLNNIATYIDSSFTYTNSIVQIAVNSNNVNFAEYDGFIIKKASDGSNVQCIAFKNNVNASFQSSDGRIKFPSTQTGYNFSINHTTGVIGTPSASGNISSITKHNFVGLINFVTTPLNWYDNYLQNNVVEFISRGLAINFNDYNTVMPIYDGILGTSYDLNDIQYKMYYIENNEKVYATNTIRSTHYTGNSGTYVVEIDSTAQGLNREKYYILEILYNDNIIGKSNEVLINIARDTQNDAPIYNESGEIISNIDLTGVTNEITNVRNEIASGNQKIIQSLNEIESGNQERQTFWENAYNSLFTISGDYVENKLNEIKESFNISGDYEEEKAFIDLITEQSGDFIISWEDFTPHFSIKGTQIENSKMIEKGEINFSKLERENEDLHNVMIWERTLLGFALGILLIKNYWKTLLHTLGIGVQVYEDSKEEVGTITQTITIDKDGNKHRTETYRKGNKTIRKEK